MLTAYANGGANAGKSYIGTISALLMQYPRQISIDCADPIRGVARTTKFIPTVADVVSWCEERVDSMRNIVEFEDRSVRQLRERQQHETLPPANPEFMNRMRAELAAAGMPIMGDKQIMHSESSASVKERYGLSDEQWDELPDAPKTGHWERLCEPHRKAKG